MMLVASQNVCELSLTQAPTRALDNVGLIIPTLDASSQWADLRRSLDGQGLDPDQILIIDSGSTDGTPALAREAGYRLISIRREDFGHGSTRQAAAKCFPQAEVLVFMTQDAVLLDESCLATLHKVFEDSRVGAAYGRQIPREGADPIERHARLFNYPITSQVRTFESRQKLGIKAAFFSNSFAAYRREALEEVGGFPTDVIMAEDSVVAARLLMAGYVVVYQANAAVIHSHPLGVWPEFLRYFDIGVHHAREEWLLKTFGQPRHEGQRFVRSELRYLRSVAPALIPLALLRTTLKYCAYQLGLRERYLPVRLKQFCSSNPRFWSVHPR